MLRNMTAYRYPVGFLLLLGVLISLIVMTVEFKSELSAFIVRGENAEQILLASEIQSGTLSRRYLLSIDAGVDQTINAEFINKLRHRYLAIDGIEDIWLPGQDRINPKALSELYLPHSSQLYSRDAEVDMAALMTPEGLQQRAALVKKLLLSPQAVMVKKILLQDPLLLSLQGFKSIAAQGQQFSNSQPRYQNLILQTRMSGMSFSAQQRIQQEMQATFAELTEETKLGYQLQMTGVPVFAVRTQQLMSADITRVSIISSIALSLLFLYLFRSCATLLWTAAILLTVLAVAVLMTNSIFGSVHGMTLAIGSTLVGICIDFPIHAIVHAQHEQQHRRSAVVSRIWPSMLLGGVTTIVGYLALGYSGYPGFQQIAVYAGSGILTSLLLTRYVLPHLLWRVPQSRSRLLPLQGWMQCCQRFRPWLLLLILLISSYCVYSLQNLQWLQDMQQFTPELDTLKQTDKKIRQRMLNSIEPGRFVLVTGETTELALQSAETVYQRLDQLKQQGVLQDYFGLYPWLLSQQRQQRNYQILRQNLTEQVKTDWMQTLQQTGLSSRLGRLEYPQVPLLSLDKVLATPIGRIIDNQVLLSGGKTLVMIWLAQHEPRQLADTFADVDHVQYFSQRDLLNNMALQYRKRAETALITGMLIIVLLLWVRYRRLLTAIQTLLPAVIAAFFIMAGWSITGLEISFLHLVGFLLAVAICVDYGIFYRENRSGNIRMTYQAMAASMLTSAIAFLSLATSQTAVLKTLAQVVSAGVMLGFLLCPLIIKQKQKIG